MENYQLKKFVEDGKKIAKTKGFNTFNHLGVVVDERPNNAVYVESTHCWVTPIENEIEQLFFEPTSPCHELLKNNSHLCFEVEDLSEYIEQYQILLEPFEGAWGKAVFLNVDGWVFELLEPIK